jgi:vitamin B12/bleomycin/antimicrobial peptide transport system ATP-binding/permease protein
VYEHRPTETQSRQDVGLSWQTARRLGLAIRNFAACEVGGRAAALAGMLLLLLLAINGLNVVNSYVGRDFMTAIERRDPHAFGRMALLYAGVFAVSTIAAVTLRFCEERLGLLWREWLTRRLVGFYLADRMYHRLQVGEGLTNPDQRIADDVRSFTTTTLSLSLIFLNGGFTLVAFSGVLWSISRPLFGVAVIYAALGSLLAIVLGRPLVRLNYDQSDREATFRATLVHVRENSESIAMLHREPHLEARLRRQIDALTSNLRRIVAVNRNLGFFTTGYNYMIQLIPALLVAPLFIRGTVEFGVIPQSAMAFAHVVGAFSMIVNQFPLLSSYGAVLARLTTLLDAAESARVRPSSGITLAEDARLAFEDVTLREPRHGRSLVRALSLEVTPGACLLVNGPGDATAALLRAVAGLPEPGDGRIVRPTGDALLVLPDRPYLPPGTLREVLVGIDGSSRASESDIQVALRAVALDDLVERGSGLDAEQDWTEVLSLEEQRLVDVARGLLGTPRFAVLARLQAGVGATAAARVLDALAARGVGCLVLGDEAAGHARFDAVIDIAPDGTWTRTERSQ